jgi:hypothetical protein
MLYFDLMMMMMMMMMIMMLQAATAIESGWELSAEAALFMASRYGRSLFWHLNDLVLYTLVMPE